MAFGGERGSSGRMRFVAARERRVAREDRGTRTSVEQEQLEQQQAALQRWTEETAAHEQPARQVGQEERWPSGPQGPHVEAGRQPRSHRDARGGLLPLLPGGIDAGHGHGRGEEAGFRSAGTAPGSDRAPGLDLLLRGVRQADYRRFPRRGGFARPVWPARQGGGDLLERAATHPRGSGRPGDAGPVRRGAALSGQPRGVGKRRRSNGRG